MKWILIGGACFILVLIISISLSGRGGRISADEFNYLRSAIDRIEHQVAAMETIAQRVELMERQETELRDSIRNMNQTLGSLSQRLATVTEKVESARSAAPAPARPASPAPEQGGIVHEVQPGETLYAIAKRYNVTIDDLVRINKLGRDLTIHPGQKLVIRR